MDWNNLWCQFSNLLEQAAAQADQIRTTLVNTMATDVVQFKYPQVRRDESVTYTTYGVEVSTPLCVLSNSNCIYQLFQVQDPYRFLEDADGEETKKFVEAQNAISDPYIKSCPHREPIISR